MAEKSALRLIPGRDALLEHENRVYQAKEYVEYNGYVYKANSETSATFVPSEWSLIGDLRDVRVPNIASRNALTGSTPTSGTTGINIPILDNTNVLVLDASGDPQVGTNVFARYNYNKTTGEFLLLQISTGSTASNVSDYSELTNKPQIISGITATAGAGLTGGGTFSGSIPPNRASFTFSHADTSAQANLTPTGRTYVQQLKFDGFGHVTGATTSAWTHPDTSTQASVNNTGFTFIQNVQLDDAGHVAALSSASWTHPDTSTQGNVTNTGNTVIQSITLDGAGHVIGIDSKTISSSGGGGGVAFSINGNSGGVRSMPDNGVLMISGASNIQSITSSVGDNRIVKLNFIPAGSNGQVQINSSGVLSGGASLTYLFNKLSTPSLALSSALTLSSHTASTTQILTRNATSGDIERITVSSISALPVNAIQFRKTDGSFGGDANFLFDSSVDAMTLGTRRVGHVSGSNSFSIGTNNIISGATSMGIGTLLTVSDNSFAVGTSSQAYSSSVAISSSYATSGSLAAGNGGTTAAGSASIALGSSARAAGLGSIAVGSNTYSTGIGSFAGGYGYGFVSSYNVNPISFGIRAVYAAGESSFNFSKNTVSQTVGHGALAAQSVILGGLNHNIESGNVRSAIIGGQLIKLTGSTYIDTVAVPSLALFTTPSAGGNDDILTWKSSTKKIGKIAQSSLVPTYDNIVYVAKNGSDSTGEVGKSSKPYLTISAALSAMNSAGIASSTNRCVVYVLPGVYNDTLTTFYNYIDIYLCNSKLTDLTFSSAVDVAILGDGEFRNLTISGGAILNVKARKITGTINTSHVDAVVNIIGHEISTVQTSAGAVNIIANTVRYLAAYGTGTARMNMSVDANVISGSSTPINFSTISTTNADVQIKANKIICTSTSTTPNIAPAVWLDNYQGKLTIQAQEVITMGQSPSMYIITRWSTSRVHINCERIENINAGDHGGLRLHNNAGLISVQGGTRIIPSGIEESIYGSGNILLVGTVYGKNPTTGVSLQVGTFVDNSTYII